MNHDFMVEGNGADQVSSFRPDRAHFGILSGITLAGRQQMANSAARAVFIVDHVGLNGAFAVSSSPTPKEKALVREYGGQPFFTLYYGGFKPDSDSPIDLIILIYRRIMGKDEKNRVPFQENGINYEFCVLASIF